jgi:ribosomal protein S18 acetylase RimI-like enzyme
LRKAALTIRPARPDDADDILAGLRGIAETIGKPHKVTATADDIRRCGFDAAPAFSVLIAESDSNFAGMCLYFPIFSSWMGKPGVYVQDLFVDEKFRGLNIGEKLLRHLAREVRDQGGAYLELVVDSENFRAQRFYERIGLPHRDDDHVHRVTGDAFFDFAAKGGDDKPEGER